MAKNEHVCLSCRVRFKHKRVREGGILKCPYCGQTFLIKKGQLTYKRIGLISQDTADFFSEGARKRIAEEGEAEPPRTYSSDELAELNRKGPSDFKCVFCGYEGGKVVDMSQGGFTDTSGILPKDAQIVKCPQCKRRHITDGERIYVNQTLENGQVIDSIMDMFFEKIKKETGNEYDI